MTWLGQERNKNDFKNDLPALKFVSGTTQAELYASPMVFTIGKASPRVVVRLRPIVTPIYDVTIGQPRPDENRMFCSGVRIVARASRQASDDAATSLLTLGVPQREKLRRQERLDDSRRGEKRISDVRRRLECGQPLMYFQRPRSYRLLT